MTREVSLRLHGAHEDERIRERREKRIRERTTHEIHADMRGRVEQVAHDLYVASGGDVRQFPWPCKGADRYRHLARAALRSLGVEA